MSLLEEMKIKQEKREQWKHVTAEIEKVSQSYPQDILKLTRLRQELKNIEGFLTQTGGLHSLESLKETSGPSGPVSTNDGQDTNNLYVGSLSPEWTEEMLSREFGRFGEITSIKIMYPRTEQQHARGMTSGFVQFKTRAQAVQARSVLNGKEFFGMALRIDWGRAIQPVKNFSAVLAPTKPGQPALMPHIEAPALVPMSGFSSDPASQASGTSGRKSRWNLAKTLVVKIPDDQVTRRLIDKTAENVAVEGWDFEQLLLEREKGNSRFEFLSVEKNNLEEPLHLYYRWRVYSFAQGDNDVFWRTEPFQIYENGPLWQPPPCEKPVAEPLPPAIQSVELVLPGMSGASILRQKLGGASTSSSVTVVGGASLTPEDSNKLLEFLAGVGMMRQSILEAMVFCLDRSTSSLTISQTISSSITEAQPGMTTQQLFARLCLLSDVLYNSHCTRPGASQYRRQFQDLLPDIFERIREVCDGISTIASSALSGKVMKLLETWTEWSFFPPRFTRGLEATLCGKFVDSTDSASSASAPSSVQDAQQQWQATQDIASLERACRQRGLAAKGTRKQLLDRLCTFEAYWPFKEEKSEPELPMDLSRDGKIESGLDGEALDDGELDNVNKGYEICSPQSPYTSSKNLRVLLIPETAVSRKRHANADRSLSARGGGCSSSVTTGNTTNSKSANADCPSGAGGGSCSSSAMQGKTTNSAKPAVEECNAERDKARSHSRSRSPSRAAKRKAAAAAAAAAGSRGKVKDVKEMTKEVKNLKEPKEIKHEAKADKNKVAKGGKDPKEAKEGRAAKKESSTVKEDVKDAKDRRLVKETKATKEAKAREPGKPDKEKENETQKQKEKDKSKGKDRDKDKYRKKRSKSRSRSRDRKESSSTSDESQDRKKTKKLSSSRTQKKNADTALSKIISR
eukprot:TRINITY_DN4221_c0_g1_i2.p1 TRINITY_DN4221_c0_g1~~TRINITY_DN4221_c0_g1_i2.p1  ORF type:complete len:911 (-),score=154.66 TRINITY_DN4221_c0_g1_i2:12-2744(-)